MTDYLKAFRNPSHVFHREAVKLAASIPTDSYVRDEVLYWKSNNRVPPDEIVLLASALNLMDFDPFKTARMRDQQTDEFLTAYRKAQRERTAEQVAEQRAEARAALGAGAKVVNIFTGEKYTA